MSIETTPLGEFRPCCLAEESILDKNQRPYDIAKGDSINDVFHSDYMNNLRQEFLDDKMPKTCAKCWSLESAGGTSKRMISNEKFGLNTKKLDIKFLDLKLGNICNLKCRICGSWSSSKWAQEEIVLGNRHAKDWLQQGQWPRKEVDLWNDIQSLLPTVEYFEFTGGEPFLIEEHFTLLEKSAVLGHASSQKIHYNTNGTTYPKRAIESIWPEFAEVEIAFSIDDIGKRFEYQRHGAVWKKVLANIKKFNELKHTNKNIKTQVCCTINIQNIYYLDTMADWIQTQDFDYVFYNYLHEAKEWNVQYLPPTLKEKIAKKLMQYNKNTFHKKQIKGAVDFMMDKNLHSSKMDEARNVKISASDKFRQESFVATFPPLKDLVW